MNKTRSAQKQPTQNGSAAARDSGDKLAVAVDPELKAAAVRRLRRIAGQVRGLESMVDQERYCADILVQIASVQEALRGVSRLLMRNHLQHCATMAIRRAAIRPMRCMTSCWTSSTDMHAKPCLPLVILSVTKVTECCTDRSISARRAAQPKPRRGIDYPQTDCRAHPKTLHPE